MFVYFKLFSPHLPPPPPWYIPSEKSQNIDPLRNSFFVANYQHWTSQRMMGALTHQKFVSMAKLRFLGPPSLPLG